MDSFSFLLFFFCVCSAKKREIRGKKKEEGLCLKNEGTRFFFSLPFLFLFCLAKRMRPFFHFFSSFFFFFFFAVQANVQKLRKNIRENNAEEVTRNESPKQTGFFFFSFWRACCNWPNKFYNNSAKLFAHS